MALDIITLAGVLGFLMDYLYSGHSPTFLGYFYMIPKQYGPFGYRYERNMPACRLNPFFVQV
jgi:hypothetical protein